MSQNISYYEEGNYNTDVALDDVLYSGIGQTFHNQGRIELDSVQLYLQKTGLPIGNINVIIYACDGIVGTTAIPTGAALATSDNFDSSTVGGAYGLEEFTFSGAERIILEANTDYAITLMTTGAWDGAKYLEAGVDNATLGHPGNSLFYSVGAWAADANFDIIFYILGEQLNIQGREIPVLSPMGYSFSGQTTGIWHGTDLKFAHPISKERVTKRMRLRVPIPQKPKPYKPPKQGWSV